MALCRQVAQPGKRRRRLWHREACCKPGDFSDRIPLRISTNLNEPTSMLTARLTQLNRSDCGGDGDLRFRGADLLFDPA